MKKILVLLVMAFAATMSIAQDSSRLAAKASKLEKEAVNVYKSSADTAISLFRQASDLYKLAGNKKAAAVDLENAAYVYEEIRKDNYKAMDMAKQAVALWRQTGDTKATADAYKYLAQQHSKMNDNLNARLKSDTAIAYYTRLNDNKGISLVQLNISAMHELQKNTDSAAKYALLARESRSKVKGSDAALFTIDNSLFRIYVLGDKLDEAKAVFKKISKKAKSDKVSKTDKLNFHYYAWIYSNKINDEKGSAENKAIYDELKKQQ